jgi:hypothetical protein
VGPINGTLRRWTIVNIRLLNHSPSTGSPSPYDVRTHRAAAWLGLPALALRQLDALGDDRGIEAEIE